METDKNEVLRYLGYRGKPGDARTLEQIDSCLAELSACTVPRSLHRVFPVEAEPGAVTVGGVRMESRDLRRHIDGCKEAAVFAATLGAPADLLLRRYSTTDMSRAVILQACSAAMIEAYCDGQCELLAGQAAERGLFLRPRYSPGYGDFPLRYQKELLAMLDCQKKIGLTATDSFMLAPSKSVTAVIGLTAEQKSCHIAKCMDCKSQNCPFRKG
jgi:hypothetical protein